MTRLAAIAKLTDNDIKAILSLPYSIRDARAGWEVAREGDRPSQCCLVVEGTFCRFKVAAHGARQIVSYHIRGDVPDLQSCFLEIMDHNLSVSREWLCNIGRREAEARIAHLICELYTRHSASGTAHFRTFPFGLTQTAIGDSQGLSTVHVNRVLQKLRGDGLIQSEGKEMTILDWPGLKRRGDFDPGYLHLRQAA